MFEVHQPITYGTKLNILNLSLLHPDPRKTFNEFDVINLASTRDLEYQLDMYHCNHPLLPYSRIDRLALCLADLYMDAINADGNLIIDGIVTQGRLVDIKELNDKLSEYLSEYNPIYSSVKIYEWSVSRQCIWNPTNDERTMAKYVEIHDMYRWDTDNSDKPRIIRLR